MIDHFHEAANALKKASCAVAVTGAGMSAESGIPTFRGTGGIWEKYPPAEYATIEAYNENPDKVWKFWIDLAEQLKDSRPNPGHYALAELERMGILKAVVTQNVDNLHQDAGTKNVIEYHGNAKWLICPRCRHRDPLDLSQHRDTPPYCFCGTLMKPDVVMFGEIGSTQEERVADLIEKGEFTKPLIAFIGGAAAKSGTRFSHAGAIIEGGRGTHEGKVKRLREVGAYVVEDFNEIPKVTMDVLKKLG